ncbi:GGDEF domain-containing protein [Actinomycetes bacterium KLBMP 9759]
MAGVLTVEGAAVAVIAGEAVAVPPTTGFALAAFVALLSIVHTELATGIERIRRRTAETSYFDLSSVWTFAAALLLPPLLASAVIIIVYAHLWQRVWRPAKVPLYRHVYTTATVVLAATAANAAVERAGGLPADPTDMAGVLGVCAAVLIYVGVNTVLVAAAIALSSTDGVSVRDLVGRLDDNALEIATLCMGALAAVALQATPGLIVMALPPILVLHRAVLVRQLEEEASTDAKTGLLNAAAWQAQAARAVRRVQRGTGSAAVLILDLDHFKHVNDDYGHLAGDDVLSAVASALQSVVRDQDVVGRFGGEEFVVLLPDLPSGSAGRAELAKVAERLRATVARLDVTVDTADGALTITGLSISIGGATVPVDGTALDQVLKVADASLYAAKRAGRNLVRIAGAAEIPVQRTGEASRAATS